MKKIIALIMALAMCGAVFAACNSNDSDGPEQGAPSTGEQDSDKDKDPDEGKDPDKDKDPDEGGEDGKDPDEGREAIDILLSADGYAKNGLPDFSVYEGTEAYRKVTTAEQFVLAIKDAKCHYVSTWDEESGTVKQSIADGYTEQNYRGTVRVIEIANDLELGYNKMSATALATGLVDDFTRGKATAKTSFTMSDMFLEYGMSQIKIENTTDLLVYSKNGAKLTHGGIKMTSNMNVVFRNIEFDEMWQWEDTADKTVTKVGDYDAFGWAYFKISESSNIWIDHCAFGKSYDGQIDYANPVYDTQSTAFRAPLGAKGDNGLHISWCKFNSGSDDPDGYIYKMMEAAEQNYQDNKADPSVPCKYLYYKALRDKNVSFEDILYGLAVPQKKGFLCGDTGSDYNHNLKLRVSFSNCIFTNLEDRVPNLRGGNAVMYNCVIDSSQYAVYHDKLKSANAASIVGSVNSKWKCALASQAIICGNGGSVYAQNCTFEGVSELLKNNIGATGNAVGGYKLVNCTYTKNASTAPVSGSSDDGAFSDASGLKKDNFSWHTEDGEMPFKVYEIELSVLNGTDGAGVKSNFGKSFLQTKY